MTSLEKFKYGIFQFATYLGFEFSESYNPIATIAVLLPGNGIPQLFNFKDA